MKKENYEQLSSELKEQFREELKINSEKEFYQEFVRTTNLENEIINKYGFDGIKLLFESRNSANFHHLGELPKDCPWTNLNEETIEGFITQNFKPISQKIPAVIFSLKERCKFIFAEKKENTWRLHYLLDMKLDGYRDYFKIYTGEAPLLNAEPNKNLKTYNWSIPNDLNSFYKIHNGFQELNEVIFVKANENIKVMAESMDRFYQNKDSFYQNKGYLFNELLDFYRDDSADTHCFYKNRGNLTVFWDHERWEISRKIGFFEFINERVSVIDEE